ncbi:MAG: histidinol phosphatase [Myxococcales bacterium]|nr:histidinol phosphatase [Myxococcales bacterium]
MKPREWLPLLEEIADRSDEISLRHFRAQDLRVEEKPDRTPVTEADLAVEEAARALIRDRHPELGVLGEEHGEAAGTGETRLIIDPIDSTANFARGIPIFATLLAIESEGEVVAGFVSAPALGARWSAAREAGAFSGPRALRTSGVRELRHAQAFHGSVAGTELSQKPPGFAALLAETRRQRGLGDFYQHMLVAEGCGELALDPELNPWDAAALQVIVEEAGGRATSLEGERSIYAGSLISTNGILHDEVLARLAASA